MKKLRYKIERVYNVVLDDEVLFEAEKKQYARNWIERQRYADDLKLAQYNEIMQRKRAAVSATALPLRTTS